MCPLLIHVRLYPTCWVWAPGVPWRESLKFTSRAQLSIKLTSCPRPALLWAELQQAPENPWPRFDREPRKAGAAWAEPLEKCTLTERLMIWVSQCGNIRMLMMNQSCFPSLSHSHRNVVPLSYSVHFICVGFKFMGLSYRCVNSLRIYLLFVRHQIS